jgi:hypothetical protein
VLLLAGVQAAVLGPAGRILGASVPYGVAALALVGVRRWGAEPARRLPALAVAGAVLAAWLVVRFLLALPDGVGAEHGFYRVKLAVTSPVGDHNTAAGLLLVALVAAVRRATDDRRWWAPAGVVVAGLVVTLSRGAAAVLLVAVGAAFAVAGRRLASHLAAASVVVVAGLVAATLLLDTSPPPPSTGVGGPLAERGGGPVGVSVLGRLDLAVRGAELAAAHPLTGVGLGAFGANADDLPRPNDHAHQALAHAAAEGGLVLLMVTAWLPLLLLRRAWRAPPGGVRDVGLLGGGALVLHAQLEILAGRIGYEVSLAVLLGLTATAGQLASRAAAVAPPTRPDPT